MEQAEHPNHQASGVSAPDAAPLGPPVAVTLWDAGQSRAIEAYAGERLMFALKRAGLSLMAVCGGKGACGTCKVAFAPDWAALLIEPDKRELRLLAHLEAGEGMRLSCRIVLTAALDGLDVDACQ